MDALPAGAPSRFDATLLVIAFAMLVGGLGAVVAAVPLELAGATGSFVATAAMVDALVLRPPTR